jgi:hypothetical protein
MEKELLEGHDADLPKKGNCYIYCKSWSFGADKKRSAFSTLQGNALIQLVKLFIRKLIVIDSISCNPL